jgi:GSH-dependent disulfide-bond oxidoreductase
MLELFSAPGVYGQKVRIVLEELGLPYVARSIEVEDAGDPLLGLPPSLRDPSGPDGLPILIAESAAIALYLARKARKLGPEGPREQATFDYWAHAISSTLAPLFGVLAHFNTRADVAQELDGALRRALHTFEEHMATRHYMVGERFTVIDALLYPHLATSVQLLKDDLAAYPNLARYRGRLAQREGVRRGTA